MLRFRSGVNLLLPGLLFILLLFRPASAGEGIAAEGPQANVAVGQQQETEAEAALAAALAIADKTDRLVLLHTGADW